MSAKRVRPPEVAFPLRRDRNGWRAVYKLGNERGDCPFQCTFCGVGRSPRVTSDENIALFDVLHSRHLAAIDGPYHAMIFNRGNVTDGGAFSSRTLDHVLNTFSRDSRVSYVSLNSRERTATPDVLDALSSRNLPYPIHFVLGQESFARSAPLILGKHNCGEMARFVAKLKRYNANFDPLAEHERYVFGLDVNLLFLPELYLGPGEARNGNMAGIAAGITRDLRQLLTLSDPLVPMEVNIHPYYEVESLPYQKADLSVLLRILPSLKRMIEDHNQSCHTCRTHLFVGIVFVTNEGVLRPNPDLASRISRLEAAFERFNTTGCL
jgi:hypothetical protein